MNTATNQWLPFGSAGLSAVEHRSLGVIDDANNQPITAGVLLSRRTAHGEDRQLDASSPPPADHSVAWSSRSRAPSSSCTVLMSAPASIRSPAKVLRRSWGEKDGIPAAPARRSRTSYTDCSRIRRICALPLRWIGTNSGPGSRARSNHTSGGGRLMISSRQRMPSAGRCGQATATSYDCGNHSRLRSSLRTNLGFAITSSTSNWSA